MNVTCSIGRPSSSSGNSNTECHLSSSSQTCASMAAVGSSGSRLSTAVKHRTRDELLIEWRRRALTATVALSPQWHAHAPSACGTPSSHTLSPAAPDRNQKYAFGAVSVCARSAAKIGNERWPSDPHCRRHWSAVSGRSGRQTDLHFDLHRRDGPNFDMPARRHAANLAEHRRSASIHNSIARPLSSFGRHRPLPQSACTDECVHSARQPLHQLLFALRRQRRAQTGTTCACACLCAWRLPHAVGPLLTLHAAKQPSSQPHRLLLLLLWTHSAKRASCRADRHRTGGVIAYSR